jgi:hypothetical protein
MPTSEKQSRLDAQVLGVLDRQSSLHRLDRSDMCRFAQRNLLEPEAQQESEHGERNSDEEGNVYGIGHRFADRIGQARWQISARAVGASFPSRAISWVSSALSARLSSRRPALVSRSTAARPSLGSELRSTHPHQTSDSTTDDMVGDETRVWAASSELRHR